MSWLARIALRAAGRGAARRFERLSTDPENAQLEKLRTILHRNADTEYGRRHGFATIRTLEEYRQRVPVVDYESIRGEIDRMARGETRVLTAETPQYFARTSGTTGKPKLIPVTASCLGTDHADQMRTWLYRALRDHPRMLDGKVVSLVSPAVEGTTAGGIPFGSTSGHIYSNLPWLIRTSYAIPYQAFEIEDYATKYYVILRLGIATTITFVCTANPSSILKLCEIANERAHELLRGLADGTLGADLAWSGRDDAVRQSIVSRLRPDPERARVLERARSAQGRLTPADYWPDLALVGCWKGGTVGNSIGELESWFSGGDRPCPAIRDWGYLSSEGRGSIPLSDEGSGGVLAIGTTVFEFVEAEELEAAPDTPHSWTFLDVRNLRQGSEYYVFLTTSGGLYRYDINDVVRVTGFYNRTPVIEFRRKGRGMTNLTGEKVSVNQIIDCFESASKEQDIAVSHFKAEADESNWRYVFKAELTSDDALSSTAGAAFLKALDAHLARINIEYRAKRASLRLRAPVLLQMSSGWYEKVSSADVRDFQRKTIKLSSREEEDAEDVVRTFQLEETRSCERSR